VSVEVLYPLNTKDISCPAIVAESDNPARWEVSILAGLVELARQDDERWQRPARRVNTLNCRDPVSIAWLNIDCPADCVRASDHFRR
jgi:hypothetical protein